MLKKSTEQHGTLSRPHTKHSFPVFFVSGNRKGFLPTWSEIKGCYGFQLFYLSPTCGLVRSESDCTVETFR
ncbi:unnamed protein product [Brassica oleracea var. botrytis]